MYLNNTSSENSKIFDNSEFGYAQIVVHRPLRLAVQLDNAHLDNIKFSIDNSDLRKMLFDEYGEKLYSKDDKFWNQCKEYLISYFTEGDEEDDAEDEIDFNSLNKKQKKIFNQLIDQKSWLRDRDLFTDSLKIAQDLGSDVWMDYNQFILKFNESIKSNKIKWDNKCQKDVLKSISWVNPNAEAVVKKKDKKGTIEYVSDTNLKDSENIPLKENIQEFFEREVLPFASDAWWLESETRIGYEINFNKYFYKYIAPRPLSDIAKDILAIEAETDNLLKEIVA